MLLASADDRLRFLLALVMNRRSVKKPALRISDRMILSALAMRLPRSRWDALIVRPETVLAWHRALIWAKVRTEPLKGR